MLARLVVHESSLDRDIGLSAIEGGPEQRPAHARQDPGCPAKRVYSMPQDAPCPSGTLTRRPTTPLRYASACTVAMGWRAVH